MRTYLRHPTWALLLIIPLFLLPAPAFGQYGMSEIRGQEEVSAIESTGSEALRNRCRKASQTLASGVKDEDRINAFWAVHRCEESGVSALITVWTDRSLDPSDLTPLLRASYSIRDSRLLDTVTGVALDESSDIARRMAALLVISEYLNPGSGTGSPSSWFMSHDPETLRVARKPSHWTPPVRGTMPITRADVEALVEPLSNLSKSGDPQIRKIAEYLLFLQRVALTSWRWPAEG